MLKQLQTLQYVADLHRSSANEVLSIGEKALYAIKYDLLVQEVY
jgi:RNA polymerase-interacting CarD/CdnL/TRCF family regulator